MSSENSEKTLSSPTQRQGALPARDLHGRVDISKIPHLIEQGDEPRAILQTIADLAAKFPHVLDVVLFLPEESINQKLTVLARAGGGALSEDQSQLDAWQSALGSHFSSVQIADSSNFINYFDIVCLGAPVGVFVVLTDQALSPTVQAKIRELCHHASVVFERHRLSLTVQSFLDRLEVLNELNQLIASNVGLQKIVKGVARESAFRFGADITLCLIANEDTRLLEPKGGFGCSASLIPEFFPLEEGLVAQVYRNGGHISVHGLASQPNHKLDFAERLGIQSVDICCLEVRGEVLGVLLMGFKRHNVLSPQEVTRFEEFCQAAGVAILNARTQERIVAYTGRLEELVKDRTHDLEVQTARAEEANKAKSRFLANMSHELRTPLTAIVGYSSFMVDGIFGTLNDKQQEAVNAIAKSSDHLKSLIDDVLNLARIEAGKEEAMPERFALGEVLPMTYKLVYQNAITKGVTPKALAIDPEIQNLGVFFDRKQFSQILINLLGNAVKYTPKGGSLWVTVARVMDSVKISVHDTGVGIPEHKQKAIFERFERGEDAYSRSQEGTGIGLNLTKRLVELNGGSIGFESQEGRGSVFWFSAPIAQGESAGAGATVDANQRELTRLDGLKLLVVDDNRDTLAMLRQILELAGAHVKTATSVREGITQFADRDADIVLTDLAMPGESGLSLIQHVRENSDSLPIIALSACAFDSDKQAALDAGASLFIPKPFKPKDVVQQVRNLTLASALQRESSGDNRP